MKNVLIYSKVMPPAIGGYVTAGWNVFMALKDIFKISVLCENYEEFLQYLKQKGIDNVTVIDSSKLEKKQLSRYDIAIYNATYENTYFHRTFVEAGIPFLSIEHNAIVEYYKNEYIERAQYAFLLIYPSHYLFQKVSAFLPDNSRQIILGLPIDENIFSPKLLSKSKSNRNNRLIMTTICMIKPIRCIEFLFDFVIYAKQNMMKPYLQIYGTSAYGHSEEYFLHLKNLSKKLDIENNIVFCGAINDYHETYKALTDSEYYIDFSKEETYGQAKIEAILAMKKIIIPDIGNNKYLLPSNYPLYPYDAKTACEMLIDNINNGCYSDEVLAHQRKHAITQFSHENFRTKIGGIIYEL